ncbi:MG2 domain-containing protein [Dyadobacter sp. CY261]|uniref:alpha-2-macroglobulin family protein n=1 Tax=Dyadobacter sp. CY261 TaxID=2907203 RepID=UPI001F247582|nr:alpha-2-macroglobulin family protein [Dyadobacter sp. CY261]MCF0073682.1 MG2 domain-containing protein [Dyadobacter sp. CY261]
MKIVHAFRQYLFITIILSLTMHTHGQNLIKSYEKEWKVVEGLTDKGLDKDALDQVRKIHQLAKKEKQEAQVIKAAMFMMQLQAENREDNAIASIRELEQEAADHTGPAKAILTSLVASQYYFYYQTVRWQLYNRTATVNFDKTDIATWGTDDFHQKIAALYLESISDEALLKNTRLEPYDAIITKGNTRKLRPTLYDLLTFKALEYFSTDEPNLKKPAYKYEINTASAFDPAADFIHRKFETKDSASLEHHALLLYQKLVAFHIGDSDAGALIDVDLARLQYVRQKSVHPDKDELYFMAVSHVADQCQTTPAAAQAWYLKALWLNEKADNYKPGTDSTSRFERVKALEICQRIIRENLETEGGINAFNLAKQITRKSLFFSVEHVNVIGRPFRVLVKYKNFNKVFLRVVKAVDLIKNSLERDDNDTKWPRLTSAQPLRAWEQSLPETNDYQEHSVEIKSDGLSSGEYVLLASSDPGFKNNEAVLGATLFYVSDISYVQKADDFFVLNRDNGQPLPGATVQLWEKSYNYNTRTYVSDKGPRLTTDPFGHFKVPPRPQTSNARQYLFEITYQQDRLFLQQNNGRYYYNAEETEDHAENAVHAYLFTDRSLYRPGQTVYYKGIVRKGKSVLNDQRAEFTVTLYNANEEHVAETKHHVSAFGSFSGSFNIPQSGLTGNFHIQIRDEYRADFRVEEYKRPRFAVEFDTINTTYKVNEQIKLTGKALAYAGNAIDGATVKYRVVRTPRMIYTWMVKRWWQPTEPMEIAHGDTITGADGAFQVNFEAIPDLKIDPKTDPVFDYTVYADVTDSNGETRSSQTQISVSYKSYVLQANIPMKLDASQFKSLSIRTENLAGAFAPADATIRIDRIVPEKRLIRNRFWQRPDQFVMTKNEYVSDFPNDEYSDETEMENWEVTGAGVGKTVSLSPDTEIPVSEFALPAGFYKIQISTVNAAGEKLTDIKFIELTDPNAKKLTHPQYIAPTHSKAIEPGEKGQYALGTSAEKAFLITSTNRKSAPKDFSYITLDDEVRTFDYTASEADRGGYSVDYMFVKHNRVHTYLETIVVPWTNKDLEIEYETFRDKTLPGSKETWKVKISGYRKEKVTAEMLGSMYDASLDQFYPHQWTKPYIWRELSGLKYWTDNGNFRSADANIRYAEYGEYKSFNKRYDELIRGVGMFDPSRPASAAGGGRSGRTRMAIRGAVQSAIMPQAAPMEIEEKSTSIGMDGDPKLNEVVKVGYGFNRKQEKTKTGNNETTPPDNVAPSIRTNFNETAFFLPDLKTDSEGNITFSFTMPEALTKWKFQALAHTQELALGYSTKEIITQKELMVQPNAPRFLREGDRISFPVKVVNLTKAVLQGEVTLQMIDTETSQPVDDLFKNNTPSSHFSVAAGQSQTALFALEIPKGFNKMVTWRAVAKAGSLSDGEENMLPVLPNRMLVTESMPISIHGTGKKQFTFEKLAGSSKSNTLTHQSVTVEYSSNPAWYAVQSLPYLMEYPYECAEQTWNRYYANTLASHIVNSSPRIAQVFKSWKGTDALQSNLSKNQELKSLLLEETPWVLASKTEEEQKRNIALLFDLAKMENELNASMLKLQEMQSSNGGFVWFKGGPDDRYITQYIVTGIGHLQKIKAFLPAQQKGIDAILEKAIPYIDKRILEDYNNLVKYKTDLKKYIPGPVELQYLYARSFFSRPIPAASQQAYQYYQDRARLTWVSQSKLLQGMTALVAHRMRDNKTANQILESLRQTAIRNEELGMYWKTSQRGWWWYEAPIERQTLLIEAFQEIGNDQATVGELKMWLLRNKQTNSWESTKATAEACYALLMTGSDWLAVNPEVTIQLGEIEIKQNDQKTESGTGYFKKTIDTGITAAMGKVNLDIKAATSQVPGWGSVYWQYFEDLDKITFAETPLKLSKKLFMETNTDTGPVLTPITENDQIHIGDKIKVRIELRVDRDMEYVHMKDLRASGLEPVNVLSGYRWQGGLGYYENTRDASTNFFFNSLRKGTYVFEYPLFITHEGDFSNGITTIQCMYAPEFTAHSEGVRIKVLPKK